MVLLEELKEIVSTPREEDISLQLLAEFYQTYISNRVYELEMRDGQILIFSAKDEHFPHLIGLHKFRDKNHSNYKLHGYNQLRKIKGFNNIRNGEISISDLKSAGGNNKKYKQYKKRILNFPFTYQLLRKSVFLSYSKELVEKNTKINGDYIFVSDIDKDKLHFFFINDSNDDVFEEEDSTVPITFIVTKENDLDFILKQVPLKIKSITVKDINTIETLEVFDYVEESSTYEGTLDESAITLNE
jgi:hypothetical protein